MNGELSDTLLALCIGVGLSAACGFRVFIPLLITSIASHAGHLELASSFAWISSTPALIAFAAASIIEIAAYYVPWLDNALDTVATPAAIIAGTIVTASMVTDMSPFLRWTLAAIAGGGAAAIVQGSTVLVRGASSATTGGLANPIFATVELGGSVFLSLMSVILPLLAVLCLVLLFCLVGKKLFKAKKETLPVPNA